MKNLSYWYVVATFLVPLFCQAQVNNLAPWSSTVTPKDAAAISNKAVQLRDSLWEQDIASKNVHINFFGQCVDQNNEPIPGVKIAMSVRHWEFSPTIGPHAHYPGKELSTGPDGRFDWSDSSETGDILSLDKMEKDGYILSPKAPRHFAAGTGSRQNPTIFKLWKKGEKQSLLSHDLKRVGVPVDGSEVQFDLLKGTKVESGGQFIMRVKRDPQILSSDNTGYNWSAEFEISNGGLVPSTNDFTYSAPASGYQETYKIEMLNDKPGRRSTFNQTFYVEFENGKYYGTLTVNLLTFHSPPPIILNLEIVINPNGSRNLQP
jgi:hypothetical protein